MENDQDDSSSSDSSEESENTVDSYSSRCTQVCEAEPNMALDLSGVNDWDFKRVDKLKFENCLEGHVGTKIVAGNVNIIVGKEKAQKFGNFLTNTPRNVCSENHSSPEDQKPRVKFLRVCAIGMLSAIVVGVIVALVCYLRNREGNNFPSNSSTNINPTTNQILPTAFTVTPNPSDKVKIIPRSEWGGQSPPIDTYRHPSLFQYVTLDNFPGDHCSTVAQCSSILKQAEESSGASLNYNFLMDDVGTLYEARGWDYQSEYLVKSSCEFTQTLKLGFIGASSNQHLTQSQKLVLTPFLENNNLSQTGNIEIKGQCCCSILDDNGPGNDIICDAKDAVSIDVGFVNNNCKACAVNCIS